VSPSWSLVDFEVRVEEWIENEDPDADLRNVVINWILSRIEDPYADARREPGFENLWYSVIPGSIHPGPMVVVCSYFVLETTRTVRCDQIASLAYPA
jgi:hypothetical protein